MAASRMNAQMAEAIAMLTNIAARDNAPEREDEVRLERFMKHKPSNFIGGYDPEGAMKWLEEVEIIFDAMRCAEEDKTTLGTYVLREEAKQWWKNVKLRIGVGGVEITWEMFKREFLAKYFPMDFKNKKVIEFMELKQGSMTVAEYAAKFESLCKFSPHYNTVEAENDKCVKFESGLRPGIKHSIGFAEIRDFNTLVAKSRICDDDAKAKNNYYKAMRGKSQDRGKPYEGKGKKSVGKSDEKKKNDGKCYMCGEIGHRYFECPIKEDKCFKCGKYGHKKEACKEKVTCWNCGEDGHKSPECKKPRKTTEKVFALDGGSEVDNLIR
ncbi:cellular nucleic acid-binding protein, partial [Trifolium medium]|nr:cellular nucleic acid-binding protein [Trifolium medium]